MNDRELNELGEKIKFELYCLLKEEYGNEIRIGKKDILVNEVISSGGNQYDKIYNTVKERINKVKIKLMEKMGFDNALDKIDWYFPIKEGSRIHYKVDLDTSTKNGNDFLVKLRIYMYEVRD